MEFARRLRVRTLLPLLIALAALGGACGDDDDADDAGADAAASPASDGASAFPRTIEDAGGAAVELAAPPTRIVSLSPGATEVLFAIGAGDRLVAADEFSDFPAAARQLEKLAYTSPDPERALALAPDLVLMAAQQREQVEQFRGVGMTVIFIEEPATVEGVLESIVFYGELTGNEEQAGQLAGELRARIDAITATLAGVEQGPRVFFELTSDLYTVAPNTFVGDLLSLAKAQNVAAGAASPFPQLSAEAVVAADPEVVLLADGEFGESTETVCARPGWDAVSACAAGRVHSVDPDLTSRPGPRVVEGLEQIARLLYPALFP